MEHAKKYVLVDPMMYRPSMPEKSLSSLDREIENALNSQLPDDEKVKLYVSALKKFKNYDNNTKPQPAKFNLDDELADSLPPHQQYKAKKLLRLIKDNPDIDWSDRGELIYKQTRIPDSHFSDLFGDALAVKRPLEGAVGWEEFDEGVASSKVPESLVKRLGVSKKKRRKWIN